MSDTREKSGNSGEKGSITFELGIGMGIVLFLFFVVFDFYVLFQSIAALQDATDLATQSSLHDDTPSTQQGIALTLARRINSLVPVTGLSCTSSYPEGLLAPGDCCVEGEPRCLGMTVGATEPNGSRQVVLRYTAPLTILSTLKSTNSMGELAAVSTGRVRIARVVFPAQNWDGFGQNATINAVPAGPQF